MTTATETAADYEMQARVIAAANAANRASCAANTAAYAATEATFAAGELAAAITNLHSATAALRARPGYTDYLKLRIAEAARTAATRSKQAAISAEELRQAQADVARAVAATIEDEDTMACVVEDNCRSGALRWLG